MTATITARTYAPTPTFVAAAARLRMIEIADATHRLLRTRPEDPAASTWDSTHQRWFDVITAAPGLPDLEGASTRPPSTPSGPRSIRFRSRRISGLQDVRCRADMSP
ncbi:hypothetical protein [Prescottella equi]